MSTVEALARIPLFSDLAPEELEEVGKVVRRQHVGPADVVVREGDDGDCVFLIVSGLLKATVQDGEGGHTTLSTMGSGELFGEIAAVDGQPRSATVTSLTATDLLAIDRFSFLRLVRSQPRFGMRVLAVMAQRLRRQTQHTVNAAH